MSALESSQGERKRGVGVRGRVWVSFELVNSVGASEGQSVGLLECWSKESVSVRVSSCQLCQSRQLCENAKRDRVSDAMVVMIMVMSDGGRVLLLRLKTRHQNF